LSEEKVVEIKVEKNRLIIEQNNKKTVDVFNFIVGTRDEHYNFACFEIIDKKNIRYFPFNNVKYLSYKEELPAITSKSCVLPTKVGMDSLNKLLGSGLWRPWGQDDDYIEKELKK